MQRTNGEMGEDGCIPEQILKYDPKERRDVGRPRQRWTEVGPDHKPIRDMDE
jgi:hypothetical protein